MVEDQEAETIQSLKEEREMQTNICVFDQTIQTEQSSFDQKSLTDQMIQTEQSDPDPNQKDQTLEEKNELKPLFFSDNDLFEADSKQIFKISKVKVWIDPKGIYGMKFEYQTTGEKPEIKTGKDQVPENNLSKLFQEFKVEGTLRKISFQIDAESVKYIVLLCEGEKAENANNFSKTSFGEELPGKALESVDVTPQKWSLNTAFGSSPGNLHF